MQGAQLPEPKDTVRMRADVGVRVASSFLEWGQSQMTDERDVSRTFPRTVDGMRVAIAGLPPDMPVDGAAEVELSATSVQQLRAVERLPHPTEVIIPYRLRPDSIVRLRRLKNDL
jgi:hypothetical protein